MKRTVLAVLCLTLAAFAQEFRGTLSGNVGDPSGARVAGAKITLTESKTGTIVKTVSDSAGQYAIPFLLPGEYDVSAEAPGFKAFLHKGVPLGAGEPATNSGFGMITTQANRPRILQIGARLVC